MGHCPYCKKEIDRLEVTKQRGSLVELNGSHLVVVGESDASKERYHCLHCGKMITSDKTKAKAYLSMSDLEEKTLRTLGKI